MPTLRRRVAAVTAVLALSVTAGGTGTSAFADGGLHPGKSPTATGYGGAVSSVDADASAAALEVLRHGGNAADAAVAAAATLGVTEPYSAGIGGGGYFVFYDAGTGKVQTIDGRETAPERMPANAFINAATKKPYPFAELVSSGVSVGVPGSLATWERALTRWGTLGLDEALKPAIKVAEDGFVVDETFRQQTLDNKVRFSAFTPTRNLFLPGGDAPAVGSVFRNPDLADTYRLIARKGTDAFYSGALAEEMAATVQAPPKDPAWAPPASAPGTSIPAFPGYLTTADLAAYTTLDQDPTHVEYRGYDVYGMAPSSSGGTTVGEALNILEPFNLGGMSRPAALHHYLEATALAFADRGKYVGDPAFVDVPTAALTDPLFGKERSCAINPATAAAKPVPAGDVSTYDGVCPVTPALAAHETDTENLSTTNLTVADKWGNVVEYTLTIEQTGGSGIVVPGRGFLLNNELTDFSYDSTNPADPNRVEPGKRPRSSMSPTIILKDDEPFLALGSPGGSTIITTVLQTILNRVDLGMSVSDSIAAPRASQRNTASVTAEPGFISAYGIGLAPFGHKLVPAGDAFTSAAEIGAATAIEFGRNGRMEAAAEPARRGGGSAMVVKPER
ncbi:gamma-glutamyltransferase family protein [Pseudarthrobacter sp. H3Y2-7]|uniref:gamma-glutamyltransferase family protein n=1 Tax=Pseudarthrobacter naphthalenicus TaxID=3031328 RepID=UPI0023B13B5A|nr:gamma-glutamyltransferase family protein [Pseudarthrobacter sp. H3Y2-7]MDE8669724.1 gamma-glutamyltransferase family protein [Pseudarthrobacter sp. H3Y2-7]